MEGRYHTHSGIGRARAPVGPGRVGAAPEFEVGLVEGSVGDRGVGHFLEEIACKHHLDDPRGRLPLPGNQLRIEVGEFVAEAGFPHGS